VALLAFAQHAQRAVGRIVVVEIKIRNLLSTQPASVGDSDQRSVAQPVDAFRAQVRLLSW
jgi:hypothetical protein